MIPPWLSHIYLEEKKDEEGKMLYGNTKCQKMSGEAVRMGRSGSSLEVTLQEKSQILSTI